MELVVAGLNTKFNVKSVKTNRIESVIINSGQTALTFNTRKS